MGVRLEATEAGVLMPVQALPKARRNAVTGTHAGHLKVSVTRAAEKGKANEAIRGVLAKALALRKAQLRIVAGEMAGKKQFLVTGASLDTLRARIALCLNAL